MNIEKYKLTQLNSTIAVGVAIIFYYLFYIKFFEMPLIGIPTFTIDYIAVTAGKYKFVDTRVVSTFLTTLIANISGIFFKKPENLIYLFQHLTLFIYFFSVYKVTKFILNKEIHFVYMLAAWLVFISLPSVIENTYKLETIVGNFSKIFGAFSLLMIIRWIKDENKINYMLFILFYSLSIFSKEDFLIAPLIFLSYFIFNNQVLKAKFLTFSFEFLTLGSVLLFFFIFNKIIFNNSFLNLSSNVQHPYFFSITIASIFHVFYNYLTNFGLLTLLIYFFILPVLAISYFLSFKIHEFFLIIIISVSLIAPYLILPNHVFSYYAINSLVFLIFLLVFYISNFPQPYKKFFSSVFFIFALYGIFYNSNSFFDRAFFYKKNFLVSFNILNTLNKYKDQIKLHERILIIGVGPSELYHTPWQHYRETFDDTYFGNNLGINTQWIVLTKTHDEMYPETNLLINEIFTNKSKVIYINKSKIDTKVLSKFPRIIFDSNGKGIYY